jgi:hypothetical protein
MNDSYINIRKNLLLQCLAVFFILYAQSVNAADTAPNVPLHLTLARELQANVPTNQNNYRHTEQISMPSDSLGQDYKMFADCSGLAIALLDRAASPARSLMTIPDKRKRPLAEDFVNSIQNSRGFQKINTIGSIKPGDIIAWEFTYDIDKKIAKNTGHVMLIDTLPVKVENRPPLVPGTSQYEIYVIDSSQGHHDPQDTRVQADGSKIQGLGRGKLRLYSTPSGEIVGFANNFANAMFQPFNPDWAQYSTGKSKIGAIGRAIYQ